MMPNTAPLRPKKTGAALGSLLLALCCPAQADVKDLLATDPVIQKLKLFGDLNANSFSRADATVLLDRLLIFTVPSFDKDMGEYLNPFGDVNGKSDYYAALIRLAYYRGSDNETVVTRENNLFRPLDYVTRQEFLKMAMQGFNIPVKNTNNLAAFNDEQNIAAWALKYFSTAVAQGIIVGDAAGNLNPDKNLTTYEALLVLDRIVAKYDKAYLHDGAGFDAPEAVDLGKLLSNTLGVEREPSAYEATATPIDITDVVVEKSQSGRCGAGAKVLRAIATLDPKAAPYYWWTVSSGYLGKYRDADSETAGATLQKVCFYPATTAVADYRVTVDGGDNLGFIDSYRKTLPATTFAVANASHNATTVTLAIPQPLTSLTAGQLTALDLTGSRIKEGGLNVALEQVEVTFTIGTQMIPLFSGGPNHGDKILFAVPVLENLYGKTGTLTVSVHTQDAKKSKVFRNVRYLPKYLVQGEVMNTGLGAAAKAVRIGASTVGLDENNGFYAELAGDLNAQTLTLEVLGGDEQNSFAHYPITFTYRSPTAYVLMVGENALGDSDSDGMPDAWERRYGLNPYDPSDAALDPDKDGFANLAEFNGGSDPGDATSKPLVIKATAGDKQVALRWTAIAGATRYGVCYATEAIADINGCLNYAGGAWLDTTKTALKISGLTNGKQYYFRALAADVDNTLRVSGAITATPQPSSKPSSALNDTGIATCSDASMNGLACPVSDYPGQDAEHGRDATHNDDSDGHAGFSFTKIAANGAELPASATEWSCVKDNVTGLMWEVKTDDGGLHDKDWVYKWYEPDNTKNGGFAGYQSGEFCGPTRACDTYAYVNAVNAEGWCGYNDWRMPAVDELMGIVSFGGDYPSIDGDYFPYTQQDDLDTLYWSGSPYAYYSDGAWIVDFNAGYSDYLNRGNLNAVRLVRGGQ